MRQSIRKREELPPPAELQSAVKKQIGYTVGAETFDNRDPLYHITEYFQRSFDLSGMQLGSQLADESDPKVAASEEGRFAQKTSTSDFYRPAPLADGNRFLAKFAETSFQRGTLASSVFRGTGQMMLFTCLKRTIGQFQPRSARQRMLFGGSVEKNVAAQPAKVLFNRSTFDSAIGLVVDVTRDARRVLEALSDVAAGKNVLPKDSGMNTLRLVYPFLNDDNDAELLAEYRARLESLPKTAETAAQRSILERAAAKTEALIDRKRYMKFQFMTKLRELSDNAAGALKVFSDDGYAAAVSEVLGIELSDDGGDDDGGDGGDA